LIHPIFFQGYNQNAAWREIFAENLRLNRQKRSPMTETAIPQTRPAVQSADEGLSARMRATPLATLLAEAAAPKVATFPGAMKSMRANSEQLAPPQVAYRGVLTPRELDAPQKETAAFVSAAAVHDLGWLRRVAVRGEDRFRWLSGMVTNTVNELGENAGAWNLVLNAQGRIQGDLHVGREGDTLELTIAADQYDRLLAHLERFIIMDDVELVPLSEDSALGLAGPSAARVLARLGLPALAESPSVSMSSSPAAWNGKEIRVVRGYGVLVPHYELWLPSAEIPTLWRALIEAGATPVGAATLEAFRIAEGIPAYGIDIAERDLPQETSQMRALHFNKGCYLGQEIVERIHSRGSVHRHLRPLEIFGPLAAAGTELTMDGGAIAGQITSMAELQLPAARRVFALAMIRGEAELSPQRHGPVAGDPELRNQSFTYSSGAATGTARILAAPPKLEDG
jgi:folate-binding protein YgfZ